MPAALTHARGCRPRMLSQVVIIGSEGAKKQIDAALGTFDLDNPVGGALPARVPPDVTFSEKVKILFKTSNGKVVVKVDDAKKKKKISAAGDDDDKEVRVYVYVWRRGPSSSIAVNLQSPLSIARQAPLKTLPVTRSRPACC